jgi:hypothetical protein
MIFNYTGKKIIINTDEKYGIDFSDIRNYMPKSDSIILADGESKKLLVNKLMNIYIITENCKNIGHFPVRLLGDLPQDPIIYVGLRKGNTIWMSNNQAFPSDVDFGLCKVVDQSKFWIMLLNPVYYFTLIFIIFFVLTFVFVLLINKNFITFGE